MAAPKGHERYGGRAKGTPNKAETIRTMLLNSLDAVGGEAYFQRQAEENPQAYLSLIGKVIPKESILSGPDGGPIQHSINVKFE